MRLDSIYKDEFFYIKVTEYKFYVELGSKNRDENAKIKNTTPPIMVTEKKTKF